MNKVTRPGWQFSRQFSHFWLQTSLYLRRIGYWNLLFPALLLLAAAGQFYWLPYQANQQILAEQTLARLEQSLRNPAQVKPQAPAPIAERHLIRFYDALGERSFVEQQVHTLFANAGHAGLSLRQGEYKLSFDKNGGFHVFQVTLPMKGTYAAIRQFCEQSLLQIPFMSLDEVSFKRDQVANRTLEARVKFNFYLSDADSVADATVNALVAEAIASRIAQQFPAPKREGVVEEASPQDSNNEEGEQ